MSRIVQFGGEITAGLMPPPYPYGSRDSRCPALLCYRFLTELASHICFLLNCSARFQQMLERLCIIEKETILNHVLIVHFQSG